MALWILSPFSLLDAQSMMPSTEGNSNILAPQAAGATKSISARFDKDNPAQFCDKTDKIFQGWLLSAANAPTALSSDGTGPSAQGNQLRSAIAHANESMKLRQSMAVGIHESEAGMVTWPQQKKIDWLPEQPSRFYFDDATSSFGDAPSGLHQEQLIAEELGVQSAWGVVGQGIGVGGQEFGWMGGELGTNLLSTVIGAGARVPAQGTDKSFQMWFSVNSNSPTATFCMDLAEEPSEADVRPSAPMQRGGAEQPDHVDQCLQATQVHSGVSYPNSKSSPQQS